MPLERALPWPLDGGGGAKMPSWQELPETFPLGKVIHREVLRVRTHLVSGEAAGTRS